jgi:hypothetical protein
MQAVLTVPVLVLNFTPASFQSVKSQKQLSHFTIMVAVFGRRSCLNHLFLFTDSRWRSHECQSIEDAVDQILKRCPREFRRAVRDSGHFLFRGEDISCPTIMCPEPDLLSLSTYGDEQAVEFFTSLENKSSQANLNLRPSRSHIGTANKAIAAEWGSPVSVWPLGSSFEYMWPRQRDLIYVSGEQWNNNNNNNNNEKFVSNHGLQVALEHNKEVMFTTAPATCFLALPEKVEDQLRFQLEQRNYGL